MRLKKFIDEIFDLNDGVQVDFVANVSLATCNVDVKVKRPSKATFRCQSTNFRCSLPVLLRRHAAHAAYNYSLRVTASRKTRRK